jgi:flotillin
MFEGIPAAIIVGATAVGALVMLVIAVASLYHKAAPGEALVVYGFRGPRIVAGGGGAVIYPVVENYQRLSLEPMAFEVAPGQSLHTREGAVVAVEALAQVKVKSNSGAIHAAAEWFLSKTSPQREELIRQMMESHLRTLIAHLSLEESVNEPEKLAVRVEECCAADIDKMGLEMVSLRIKSVCERQGRH